MNYAYNFISLILHIVKLIEINWIIEMQQSPEYFPKQISTKIFRYNILYNRQKENFIIFL